MRDEKAILEITTICDICEYTSVRKVSMFDMRLNHKKISRNFYNNDICLKCLIVRKKKKRKERE